MSASSDDTNGPGRGRHESGPADSVDAAEVEAFDALAAEWWDTEGPLRTLHRLNPARIGFIRDHVAARFGREAAAEQPLRGLSVLDIGTGGGLAAEPMARLGAAVTAIDPSEKNIGVASAHAREMGLDIAYRVATAERLAAEGARFDVVMALEVVEHVADLGLFLDAAAGLVASGGALAAATLNRTAKAYALAIVGAEYVLGWLPRGTHDWNKFVTPDEMAAALESRGLEVGAVTGVVFNPLTWTWRLSRDTGVNYMLIAAKGA